MEVRKAPQSIFFKPKYGVANWMVLSVPELMLHNYCGTYNIKRANFMSMRCWIIKESRDDLEAPFRAHIDDIQRTGRSLL